MKKLNNYITEKLHLNKDTEVDSRNIEGNWYGDKVTIKDISDLLTPSNKRYVGQFLKGKRGSSSLKICLQDKYIHVHRYAEGTYLSITLIISPYIKWPETDEWKNAPSYIANPIDPMNKLFNVFYNFLEYRLKNK